mgnify:CR=1 FL=1
MPSKIPILDASSKESILGWDCDMQDLQGEATEAIEKLLDQHSDAASLAAAITEYLAAYNDGEDDQHPAAGVGTLLALALFHEVAWGIDEVAWVAFRARLVVHLILFCAIFSVRVRVALTALQ